ncbi:hypothetical protein LCGC14_1248980 [marine sediment metagenome]|uniref:Uncharacterized protein n=1 Tax=marine sediment metagenome TaxID=412755 RepID=A0A0F9NKX5_9ZZZZ
MAAFKTTLKKAYIRTPEFSGVGLDDLASSGTYTDTKRAVFTIIIDDDSVSPETFKWQKDDGTFTTGVNCAITATTLSDGVTVTFGAIIGHTNNEQWTVEAIAPQIDAKLNAAGTILSIRDHSNYLTNTETEGHDLTDFINYRRLYITPLNGTEVDLNELSAIPPPYDGSAANSNVITYDITQDDVYELRLVTVPTWSAGTYTIDMCTWYGSLFYVVNVASTTGEPGVSSEWTEITEATLETAYYEISTIAPIYQLNKLRDEQVYAYYDDYERIHKEIFYKDENSIRRFKALVIMYASQMGTDLGGWNKVQNLLVAGNDIFNTC